MKFIPRLLLPIWRAWNLQIFVLISLILQVILIFAASFRKSHTTIWLRAFLWLAYMLADPVAILALGILAHSDLSIYHSHNRDLLAFWAPFLLLHLGGPDTITAFSLEDTELWLRHLLNLVVQVGMASYVFVGTLPKTRLLVPVIFMFLAGILKYAERTVALWLANMNRMRNSMITKRKYDDIYLFVRHDPEDSHINLEEEKLISKAHRLMQAFVPLFADLSVMFGERHKSIVFFRRINPVQAFKVIDAELAFHYERLYTKSAVIETVAGCVLRLITLSSILASLILFILTKKDGYLGVDTAITYILLAGALALECYSVGLLIFSDWAFIKLKDIKLHYLSKLIFTIISFFRPPIKPRLCNSMSKCNLISFWIKHRKPTRFKRALEYVGWKEAWYKFRQRGRGIVSDEMKEFLFEDIKRKSLSINSYEQHFCASRGQKTLQNSDLSGRFTWSIEVSLHCSIILWHIATDICYHAEQDESINASMMEISKQLSDYMLYLVIKKPFMVTTGIEQIIYGDVSDTLEFMFSRVDAVSERVACTRLLDGDMPPHSGEILFDGRFLARQLRGLENRKWEVISGVWVEMLCFAAAHCRGTYHAKWLSAGGEFLTFIWLLINHLSPVEIDEPFGAVGRPRRFRAELEEMRREHRGQQ